MNVNDLVAQRRKQADEKNRKAREAYARKSEERNLLGKTPLQIIARDQKILKKQIDFWKQINTDAENQIRYLIEIYEKTKKAGAFIETLNKSQLEELRIPQNWQKYSELDYIYDMRGLF
jgi:hypothetical protein